MAWEKGLAPLFVVALFFVLLRGGSGQEPYQCFQGSLHGNTEGECTTIVQTWNTCFSDLEGYSTAACELWDENGTDYYYIWMEENTCESSMEAMNKFFGTDDVLTCFDDPYYVGCNQQVIMMLSAWYETGSNCTSPPQPPTKGPDREIPYECGYGDLNAGSKTQCATVAQNWNKCFGAHTNYSSVNCEFYYGDENYYLYLEEGTCDSSMVALNDFFKTDMFTCDGNDFFVYCTSNVVSLLTSWFNQGSPCGGSSSTDFSHPLVIAGITVGSIAVLATVVICTVIRCRRKRYKVLSG